MTDTNDLFGDALNEVANGPRVGSHEALTEALMRRLHEKGLRLADLASDKMMSRSLSTLQMRARRYDLAFPDYVPMRLRPKKGKAKK